MALTKWLFGRYDVCSPILEMMRVFLLSSPLLHLQRHSSYTNIYKKLRTRRQPGPASYSDRKRDCMCGRYTLFTEQEQQELYNIIKEVEEKLDGSGKMMKTGEIYPTNLAPVLVRENERVTPEAAVWGFPQFQRSGVIINARAETAADKRMFAKPLSETRCVVPAGGFYEWDKAKTKYLFRFPENEPLYMAGILNRYQNDRRFVILTTDANTSMQAVHNRMPVMLKQNEVEPYLWDYQFALSILNRVPAALVKTEEESENGQLHF